MQSTISDDHEEHGRRAIASVTDCASQVIQISPSGRPYVKHPIHSLHSSEKVLSTYHDIEISPNRQGTADSAPDPGAVLEHPMVEHHAQRTVQLYNLPKYVTHAEIIQGIRGGQLLDVFLRPREHIVHISFVESEAAHSFFHHVKRNDFYVRGKRVRQTIYYARC